VITLPFAATEAPLLDAPARGDARAVRLLAVPFCVPEARRAFVSDVAAQVDRDVAGEAAVVVSELLGNAVRHAPAMPDGRVLMRWQVRDGVVDVEVTDGGGSSPVEPRRPSTRRPDGRGLRIVRSLSEEWGVIDRPDGCRTVWASIGGASRRRHPA
jgi:two-component sensor histidine kinase